MPRQLKNAERKIPKSEVKKKKGGRKKLTFLSSLRANKAIISKRDIRWPRHILQRDTKLSPQQLNLNRGLSVIPCSLNWRFEISHRISSKNSPITNAGRQASAISKNSIRSRDQKLIILKTHKNLPRFELIKAVILYTQRGLESVGLVGWISGLELGSSSILVGQKNPIAGIGRRRWCFDVSLGDSKGYYSNKDQKGQIEVKSHELPGRNETEVRNGNAQGIFGTA